VPATRERIREIDDMPLATAYVARRTYLQDSHSIRRKLVAIYSIARAPRQLELRRTTVVQALSHRASRKILMTPHNANERRCLLCERVLRRIGQDFTGKKILRCDECDYVTTPVSTPAENDALYDDPKYFDGWGCNFDFDYERFEPAVHKQMEEYLQFIGRYTRGKSLLDIGTGHGLLPHLARARGYEVEGTDVSKHVSETLPAKVGFPIHHGTIEQIDFTRKYDIITMLHVLEHTSNPVSTLKRCQELLKESGFIVVVVPNYASIDTRIKNLMSRLKLKGRPYKHLALGHHNFVFSIKSLEVLGRKCELKVAHRETRQPAWRSKWSHRLLEHFELATWCWIVYQST
jgi:2-polyprenyl-3-methyl-5-hydroxy-6-metoxy-1,4-benzoquinol methylase